MLLFFNPVDFSERFGKKEKAVEVYSQITESGLFPSPPLPAQTTRKWCKAGWIRKRDVGDPSFWTEMYGVVSEVMSKRKHKSIRRLSHQMNGATSFFMIENDNFLCERGKLCSKMSAGDGGNRNSYCSDVDDILLSEDTTSKMEVVKRRVGSSPKRSGAEDLHKEPPQR